MQHLLGDDPGIAREHVQDHPRPLILVGQVGRVHQDQLPVPGRQLEVLQEDRGLVSRVLVQADLADAQDAGLVQELGNHRDHLPRQSHVLGFLGVDAKPAPVLDAVGGRSLSLELRQLAKIIAEPLRAGAVETRPERGLAHEHATGQRHPLVVVGNPRHHVDVRIDILHGHTFIFSRQASS